MGGWLTPWPIYHQLLAPLFFSYSLVATSNYRRCNGRLCTLACGDLLSVWGGDLVFCAGFHPNSLLMIPHHPCYPISIETIACCNTDDLAIHVVTVVSLCPLAEPAVLAASQAPLLATYVATLDCKPRLESSIEILYCYWIPRCPPSETLLPGLSNCCSPSSHGPL